MPSHIEQAIIKTLVYSDVFDYPLTREEIGKWVIKCDNATMRQCKKEIKNITSIKSKRGFYFLKGREAIIDVRKEREEYSWGKFQIAQKIADVLKLIPSVKCVGITGALSVNNAKENDDIDLFIITSSGLLWTTRLLVTLLVEITGMRRHPQETNTNNKICLNMFADEGYLEIPKGERDLFSAHEVLQMKLLWDRDNTYQKFLSANQWVKKYLPNALYIKNQKFPASPGTGRAKIKNTYKKLNIFSFAETVLKKFQLWYMRKKRTTEVIKDGIIRFHPHDARSWVTRSYQQKLRSFSKLPLDNIFPIS